MYEFICAICDERYEPSGRDLPDGYCDTCGEVINAEQNYCETMEELIIRVFGAEMVGVVTNN